MALEGYQGVSHGVPMGCCEKAWMQKRPGLEGKVVAPDSLVLLACVVSKLSFIETNA